MINSVVSVKELLMHARPRDIYVVFLLLSRPLEIFLFSNVAVSFKFCNHVLTFAGRKNPAKFTGGFEVLFAGMKGIAKGNADERGKKKKKNTCQ